MDVNEITDMMLEKIFADDKKGAIKTAREAVQAYADIIADRSLPCSRRMRFMRMLL